MYRHVWQSQVGLHATCLHVYVFLKATISQTGAGGRNGRHGHASVGVDASDGHRHSRGFFAPHLQAMICMSSTAGVAYRDGLCQRRCEAPCARHARPGVVPETEVGHLRLSSRASGASRSGRAHAGSSVRPKGERECSGESFLDSIVAIVGVHES